MLSNSSDTTELNISDNFIDDNNKIFTINDKKKIVNRIEKIKNKKIYLKIFKIIHNDNCKYTFNSNGVFLNITNLQNNVLYKIEQLLDKYDKIFLEKNCQNDNKLKLFINLNNNISTSYLLVENASCFTLLDSSNNKTFMVRPALS